MSEAPSLRLPEADDRPLVMMLCTGNAARSVMAGAALAAERRLRVVTAGTHAVEHQPMSIRTRTAMTEVGLAAPGHRSRQLTPGDVDAATLIVAMAAEHVHYIRRRHPSGAARTATLPWLADNLPAGPEPLARRVAALRLDRIDPEQQGDIDDPAGGDDVQYQACARQIVDLMTLLGARLL